MSQQAFFAEIKTYEITIGRSLKNALSHFKETWDRQIILNMAPYRSGKGVTRAVLNFYEKEDKVWSLSSSNRWNNRLLIRIPISDFSDVYRVLQTERPINLLWVEATPKAKSSSLSAWRITTSREPIGEGESEF